MTTVSVVIPVYNQQAYIAEAIDSVLAQTFKDYETIVVDDGSTDGTSEILARYGNAITCIRQPNQWGAAALNTGIRHSRGRWIGWLSSDDVWEPTKLEKQVHAAENFPRAALVYTDYVYIDVGGKVLSGEHFPCPDSRRRRLLWLIRRCRINGSSTLIRKDVFESVGMYDESDRFAPDWDMFLRIALDYEFAHVPEPLVRYRLHPNQTSARRDEMERAARRVASRNMRRFGRLLGSYAAAKGFNKQLRSFPAHLRNSVGYNRSIPRQAADLLEWLQILVNPNSMR